MRVVVVNLTSGGISGGYRKYLARLMPLMANDPRVTSLTVFAPAGTKLQIDRGIDLRTWSPQTAWRQFEAPVRDVAALAPHVVFVPTARYARFGAIPTVAMVRNMEPLTVPFGGNSIREGLKNVARARAAHRACRRASRVIAVSEHVRDFLVTRWHLDPGKVGVAYHGVDSPEMPGETRRAEAAIFTAGSIRPARGLEDAIAALGHLPPHVRLTIGGRVDPGCESYGRRLEDLARRTRVSARITWAGQLDTHAMLLAFASSTAFVMTSRAEACPNTALEAMCGACPVVSVDRAPMPEFFGDAAVYYPTGDARALADRLGALLVAPHELAQLGRRARARAACFTWESTRDRTIQELERAVA